MYKKTVLTFKGSRCMLSDNPSFMLKMITLVAERHKMYIGDFMPYNKLERNFRFYLYCISGSIDITYNYEEDEVIIECYNDNFNNVVEDLKKILNVNYKKGEIVKDTFGTKYRVLRDFKPKIEDHGLICMNNNRVKLEEFDGKEIKEEYYAYIMREI